MMVAFELLNQRQGRGILTALRQQRKTARTESERLRRTWFDTFDWRLWRAHAALSMAGEGRDRMLHWQRHEGGAERAEPIDTPPEFAWDLPPGRLRRELARLIEMRRLLPLIELERRSESVPLLDRRDKTVARLRLEGWRVRRAPAPRAKRPKSKRRAAQRMPPRLVALPVRGYRRDFDRLLGFLELQGLQPATRPVLDQAYEACGLEPGGYRAKVRVPLEPGLPAHLAMRRIYRQLLDTMRSNEEGLLQDLDSEFLHDFRVALRRTRSALSQVRVVLPPEQGRRFRQEFSWLGGRTGALRDLDVYLLKLDDYRASLSAEAADGLAALEALLRRKQKQEHRRVTRVLRGQRYRRLLTDWAAVLADEELPGTPSAGLLPIARVARDRLLEMHARVIRKGRRIGPKTPEAKLHRLRIDCKKLRYLLEFFRQLYPATEIGKVIGALKGLQDNLGDFNDLSVQQDAMEQFAEELKEQGAPAGALLAMGQLIGKLAGRHARQRRRFGAQFERFDRRKVRKRLIRLVEEAAR